MSQALTASSATADPSDTKADAAPGQNRDSGGIAPRLRQVEVNLATKASDHQPVLVELGG